MKKIILILACITVIGAIIIFSILLLSRVPIVDHFPHEIGSNINNYSKYESDSVSFDYERYFKDFSGLRIIFINKSKKDLQYFIIYNDNEYNRINYWTNDSVTKYICYDSVFVRKKHKRYKKFIGIKDEIITKTIKTNDLMPLDFTTLISNKSPIITEIFKLFDKTVIVSNNELFLMKRSLIIHYKNGKTNYFYFDKRTNIRNRF
jgi:hypothetical protein